MQQSKLLALSSFVDFKIAECHFTDRCIAEPA
jgi:hypothetical protein